MKIPKDIPPFEGFPAELPDFLWGLALNNEKPWFLEHKAEFERCLNQPFRALAWSLWERLQERMPELVPQVHISRIYRDARRLHGRGPYNDHLWFSMGITAQMYTPMPQYWFGINAHQFDWGMGIWQLDAAALTRWRAAIDANPAPLAKLVRKVNKMDGVAFCGEVYKRPKGDPGSLLYDWYNARSLAVGQTVEFDTPPDATLLDTLEENFCALASLYRYWMKIYGNKKSSIGHSNAGF